MVRCVPDVAHLVFAYVMKTRQEDNIRVDEDHKLAQIEDAVIDALG